MDINSLLSPDDTPAASPSPRSSPATARRTKSQTSIPNIKASPLSQPLGSSSLSRPFAPPPLPSPPINSLAQNISQPLTNPSSASSSPRIARPAPTTGMDTLADLASMQHHQRTTRGSSGGMRGTNGQEKQAASSYVRPSLQAIARTHSGSRSSLDIRMADIPTQTPPPRAFRSSSLPDQDLQQVGQLAAYLAENPGAYGSHVQLIKILHRGLLSHVYSTPESPTENDPRTYDLLSDLEQATEAMASRFSLGEELWIQRLESKQLLALTLEDCLAIVELYEKAVAEEVASTKLWGMYGEWMLSLYGLANSTDHTTSMTSKGVNPWIQWSEEDKMLAAEVFNKSLLLEVWKRGVEEVRYNLSDSHLVWNKYTDLLLQDLGSNRSDEAFSALKNHFIDRLQTPHSAWDETFQRFSSLISEYDNASYEQTMISVNSLAATAKSQYDVREAFELKLSKAIESGDQSSVWVVFNEYLEWEMPHNRKKKTFSFELANALFQRAALQLSSDTNIWEDHLALLSEEGEQSQQSVATLSLLGRACSHCPWSGTLWSHYIQAAERHNLPFADIGQIKHKATSTGLLDSSSMEDVLKIHTAWCSFLRRRAFARDSSEEDPDVAEVGILSAIEDMEALGSQKYGKKNYKGDPQYRLERIYIKFLDQGQKSGQARERWKNLIGRHGGNYEFWLRYYWWEMTTWAKSTGDQTYSSSNIPREATKVLKQAAKRTDLDWPEKILDNYLSHCEDHEDATEIQIATVHWRQAMKAVAKRREKEALQAAEYSEQQRQQQGDHVATTNAQNGQLNGSKRKRDENEEVEKSGGFKKSRTNGTETEEVQETQSEAQSAVKRDRENTTVLVKNLPSDTNEKWVRHFFRDCGTIHSVKLSSEDDGDSIIATIEFDSKEDVLTAQTKDQKNFRGNTIEVQAGTGTTLYVTNFPPSSDESYIRELFGQYGEVIDVRFPSLKYNTHRRFCYVQFKSAEDAASACELDERRIDGDLKLVAKMSDPGRKEKRHGAMYEGREVYAANVDWSATEEDLKEVFSKYGKVERVRIPKNLSGKSKGMAFIVFSSKDEAESALDLNNTKFKSRILSVSLSTANPAKRQATTLINPRTSTSPSPDQHNDSTAPSPRSAASPPATTEQTTKANRQEISSRTVALLNVPDTVNDARIRTLMEPHGALTKIVLRPDHQGAIVEFADVADAGKAALAVDGYEIQPGRKLGVGSVSEMLAQKAEKKENSMQKGKALQAAAPIRRPGLGSGGRRGGLGKKMGRPGGDTAAPAAQASGAGGEAPKTNADFKAMFVKGSGGGE